MVLTRDEALELVALGEVIARKAGCGRQLGIQTARATGASWSQIGAPAARALAGSSGEGDVPGEGAGH